MEKVDNRPSEYGKDFMKIKFNSDSKLPLNKLLKLFNLTVVVRSFFKWMFVWIIQILQYERIDVSEEIDINKSNK